MSLLTNLPKRARVPLICALLLPSVLLIISAIQAQRSEDRLVMSYRWVSHTHEVERELQTVDLSATQLALAGPHADSAILLAAIRRVAELTHDNVVQQQDVPNLKARARDFLSGTGAFSATALAGLNEVSNRMYHEEERLLKLRQNSLLGNIRGRTFFLWGLVALNSLLLVGVSLLVRRLSQLERFVRVCAWTRTIEFEGEWISFETYLERRFQLKTSHGIAPEEAERILAELRDNDIPKVA